MVGFTRSLKLLSGFAAVIAYAGTAGATELKSFQSAKPSVAWAYSVGETDAQIDEIDGISVDDDGNAVISGILNNKLTFAGTTMTSRGEGDIFLISIAANGKTNWAHQIGGKGDDNTFDLTTDSAGNIYASGWYTGTVDFGGQTVTSKGGTDQFVAKYSQGGKLLWVTSLGGRRNDGGNEISVLDNGEIAVSAMSNGDFEAGGQTFKYGGGQRDAFLIRMSAGGDVKWVTHVNGPGTERIRAVSMAPSGDVYLGFQYKGTLNLQGQSLTAKGNWDGAAARLNSKGDLVWLQPVGSKGVDNVRGIGVGPDGNIYASGVFAGPGIMFDREVPVLGGKGDDYVVRLSPAGKPLMFLSLAGPGRSVGTELQADRRGVVISGMQEGPLTVRRNAEVIATIEPTTKMPSSYVAAFDAKGKMRFIYSPSPSGGKASGAFGDVLSVSRNGRYLVQALRYRDKLTVDGKAMSTPSKMDSVVVFLRLNGS